MKKLLYSLFFIPPTVIATVLATIAIAEIRQPSDLVMLIAFVPAGVMYMAIWHLSHKMQIPYQLFYGHGVLLALLVFIMFGEYGWHIVVGGAVPMMVLVANGRSLKHGLPQDLSKHRYLAVLAKTALEIQDPGLSHQVSHMYAMGVGVFEFIASDIHQAYKGELFVNHYLPRVAQVLEAYIRYQNLQTIEMQDATYKIEKAIPAMHQIFETTVHNLYAVNALEIDASILENLLNLEERR